MTEAVLVKKTTDISVKKISEKDLGMSYKAVNLTADSIVEKHKEKVIAVVSGGLDSTTMLYYLRYIMYDPIVVTFYYSQKHHIEIEYAKATCKKLGLEHFVLNVPRLPGSSLTESNISIPKEDYSAESQRSTVVANRNMVFLSIAASYAIAHGCEKVFYAAHHNDEAVYPDCTQEFVDSLNKALYDGTYEHPKVVAPFLSLTKARIVSAGVEYGVPFKETWSCYDPVEHTVKLKAGFIRKQIHCGTCGTCRERRNAFKTAGVFDPTEYSI